MSILMGSVSLKRFVVLGPVPDEQKLTSSLASHQFRPFQDGTETEREGWVDWRNPLITPPDPDWVVQERYALFGLRIDRRKVQSALVKAHVELRTQALMKEKDLAFIGKEARASIQDEVMIELLRKVQPTLKVVDVAWDLKAGLLLTTATGSAVQSTLISLFQKTFSCELQPLIPLPLAAKVAPEISTERLAAVEPMNFELQEAAV